MKASWETGWRGRIYAIGRRMIPIGWRRALRRRVRAERLLGLRKAPVEPSWGEPDPGPRRDGRPDIVVLPVIPWSYRRQRPQQLAEALARRGRRVFYLSLEGGGEPASPAGVARGVTLLPIRGVRREDPADRRLRGRSLENAITSLAAARERFELREAVQLVQSPFWAPLAVDLRRRFGWRILYDCLDAHGHFRTNRPGVLDEPEHTLAAAADLVVATSEPLRARLAAWSPSTRVLPNACDFDLFSTIPAPQPDPSRLVVGYAGAVDEWFDFDLLAELARLRPAWRFEIVGGLEDVVREAPRLPNVRFHGERPHREMPELRSGFDVEIIPFRLSPLTHATDPVKLYEAAAAGRGVVATPMRSLEPLAARGLVRLASTAREAALAIEAAAAEGEEAVRRRRAFARENTWDARAASLDGWLASPAERVPTLAEGREHP